MRTRRGAAHTHTHLDRNINRNHARNIRQYLLRDDIGKRSQNRGFPWSEVAQIQVTDWLHVTDHSVKIWFKLGFIKLKI